MGWSWPVNIYFGLGLLVGLGPWRQSTTCRRPSGLRKAGPPRGTSIGPAQGGRVVSGYGYSTTRSLAT
eukprot:5770925-Pyramimonas_sp.AAC.1